MTVRAATKTTNLGRYHIVKRLAAGGMADVLLARTIGISGFERYVVIKRIHADLGDEPRYRKMFLDEARLAASLHHHNIVQVNDIGEEDGEYFFAMEYVHGEDARSLLVEASDRGEMIPIEHVVTIAMSAAAGLHHAHEQLGPDRSPLEIVHRDVSPANILVGYDGGVKVADFGIAQAAQRAEQTQSGVLKGKTSYMSPEQCNCDPIDRRSDVFSLGIVLYELCTVRPCFRAENDFLTMSAIVNGKFDLPSTFNPSLPIELEAIILKALSGRPADRYQSCDEMRLALEQFAVNAKLRTSQTALADYMKTQFGTRPEPWLDDSDGDPDADERDGANDDEDEMAIEIAGGAPLDLPAGLLKAVPQVPFEDDLEVPSEVIPIHGKRPVKSTLPMRALKSGPVATARVLPRPAPEDVSAPAPIATSTSEPIATESPRAPRTRRLWLAASVLAVIAAALALVLVNRATPAPVASAPAVTPHEDVGPLQIRTTQHAAAPTGTSPTAAVPTVPAVDRAHPRVPTTEHTRVRAAEQVHGRPVTEHAAVDHPDVADEPAPDAPAAPPAPPAPPNKPAKKWNPDSLFPN